MKKLISAVSETTGVGSLSKLEQTVTVPHGESVTLGVTLKRDDGTSVDLTSGTIVFRLLNPVGGGVMYTVSTSSGVKDKLGYREVTASPNLATGSYAWDVWYTPSGGSQVQVVPLSLWLITQSSR